ncbi:MAG: 3-hydroxyacyl-CoA dehydrogenase NAD-binding domain-containing protein, partial [Lysobacterales bacterium]
LLGAAQARALGLVDQLVGPHGELRWAARAAVLGGKRSRRPGLLPRLTNSSPSRRLLAGMIRKKTAARANPLHYPAPFSLIDAWELAGHSKQGMLDEEAKRVGELITGSASRGLRHVFWLMDKLKSGGKSNPFKARRVHVVGAGVMGGDIAAWCVLQGLEVTLQDREMKYVTPALERAKILFRRKLKTSEQIAGAKSRLIADVEGLGVARADVVIEAIFENVEAKQELFRSMEPNLKPGAILATNTSAIPLAQIASALQQPQRLIGLHFFNPVAKMPLVEVVFDTGTDQDDVARGAAFCGQISRFPLPVKSSPGFLVNRVLFPYFAGFMGALRDGADFVKVDKVMEDFGWPMGPAYLQDVVGIDTGHHVADVLAEGYPDRMNKTFRTALDVMYESKRFGQKNNIGFYKYETDPKGKPKKTADPTSYELIKTVQPGGQKDIGDEEIVDRLMLPMIIETARCLEESIVESVPEADMGLIMGVGFPPFRGGALKYADTVGLNVVVEKAKKYEALGKVYHPTERMKEMAAKGQKYYA